MDEYFAMPPTIWSLYRHFVGGRNNAFREHFVVVVGACFVTNVGKEGCEESKICRFDVQNRHTCPLGRDTRTVTSIEQLGQKTKTNTQRKKQELTTTTTTTTTTTDNNSSSNNNNNNNR